MPAVRDAMVDDEQSPDRLLVRVDEGVAYVRVEGRGTFRVSPALKDFGLAALEQGARRLVMDFSACVGLDSTFMGVMAGLAFRYGQVDGGKVYAINLSSKTRHLLSTLGLDRFVETHLAGKSFTASGAMPSAESFEAADVGERERADLTRTMIEAHEDLIKASTANLPKFKDVLVFLREDLRRHTPEDPLP